MESINTDAGNDNIWVRTQMNAPAQRPWFTDTGGATGTGVMATGRVAANQLKSAAASLALERLQGLSRPARPHRLPRPTCRRSNSPTVSASC